MSFFNIFGFSKPTQPTYEDLFTGSYPMNIACATQGIEEALQQTPAEGLNKEVEKSSLLAKCFFGACVIGTALAYTFTASQILVGMGTIGIIASSIYWYIQSSDLTVTESDANKEETSSPHKFWQKGFELLQGGNVNEAVDHMKAALTEDSEDSHLFKSEYRSAFNFLDCRYKTAQESKSQYMITPVFGNILLHRAVFELTNNSDLSDDSYASLQKEVQLAQTLFSKQRCGIRENQEAVCKFFEQTKVEAQASIESAKIALPKQFSIGHGLLLQVYEWLHSFENRLKKDGTMDDLGSGVNNLGSWQATAEKAKVWLEKSDHYKKGSIEKKVVDGMLAASNMRELMDVILGDFKTHLNHFQSQAAPTA